VAGITLLLLLLNWRAGHRRTHVAGQTGRIILAVVAGYAANAILVVATEQLLLPLIRDGRPPLYYFVADLISQCFYTVAGGYCAA
jgi:hypothetical protein